MTKPKFTPDPPPYLQGMEVDKAFPLFVDWAMRQNNRIEDWWPKDYEARIQALERLSPYCIGEWIIADAAHVSFEGYEVATLYVPKTFLYSDPGSSYFVTESDYDSFETPAASTSGFGTFNEYETNDQGLVLAYDSGGTYWRSTDGINWTASSFPSITNYAGLVWFEDTVGGNPRWICNGSGATFGTGYYCYSSTDGINWTEEYATALNTFRPNTLHSLATDGSRLLSVGDNISGSNTAYVSDDGGENWSSYALDDTETVIACFYKNGLWFYTCLKGQLWSSPTANNGSWTLRISLGGLVTYWTEIEYGNGLYIGRTSDKNNLYTSTDGFTWSTGLSVPSGTGGKALSYDDTYGWLFCYSTTVRQSSDGLSWSVTNLGTPLSFAARGLISFGVAA